MRPAKHRKTAIFRRKMSRFEVLCIIDTWDKIRRIFGKMNIIIIGCGKVGTALAQQLGREDHNITVIDTQYRMVQKATNLADVRGVCGNGASYSIQKEAGIETANLMIAVTSADEVNLLCCLIAKKAGGCQTIARVRNPIYHREISYIKEELGLSMVINPELASAKEAARLLQFPSAIEIDTFAQGRIELLRFRIPQGSPLCNQMLKDLSILSKYEVLFCILERGNQVVIPDGFVELRANDTVSMVVSSANANRFFHAIGIETNQVKNTIIVGGGKISYYLARQLLNMGVHVKLIERNRTKCDELCELLPNATIICGDGTDQELLEEEGLSEAEGFAAFTNIDEENVMLSLYAQTASHAKMITKVSTIAYDNIINSLDIGSTINPKHITTESILQYVRAMQNSLSSNVETLYRLIDGRAEALEFIIRESGPVTDTPLQALKLRENLLVCAIYRSGRILIPKGQDMLMVGDSVVVITTNCGLKDIRDILE